MFVNLHRWVPDDLSPRGDDASEDRKDNEHENETADADEDPEGPIAGALVEAAFGCCVGGGAVPARFVGQKVGIGRGRKCATSEFGGVARVTQLGISLKFAVKRKLNGVATLLQTVKNEMDMTTITREQTRSIDEAIFDAGTGVFTDVKCQIACIWNVDGRTTNNLRYYQRIVHHINQLINHHRTRRSPYTIRARQTCAYCC